MTNPVIDRALAAMNRQEAALPTAPEATVEAAHAGAKFNPANGQDARVTEATRIPMSIPDTKLTVPDIPGYHLHWFLGENVYRALRAGYEHVDESEVEIRNFGLADSAGLSGSTDLGSRISVVAGRGTESQGQAGRLYLMKLRQEWWEKDQAKLEEKNDAIARSLRGGKAPGDNSDRDVESHRHTPNWAPQRNSKANNLFVKKPRR